MIERHHKMFPTIKQDSGSFYLRERVIDKSTEQDLKYFDESEVQISFE